VKAVFFRIGSFSLINDVMWCELRAKMPDFDWQSVDVERDIVGANPALRLRATVEALLRYGKTIVANRQPPRDFFPRLPCVLRAVSDWSKQHVVASETAFTFQTQSLFDASAPGIPHFLYTDHTYLANRRYPMPKPSMAVPQAWRDMELRLYQNASTTFVSSGFARTSVIEDYGIAPDRVVTVHSGCNIELPDVVDFSSRKGNVILFVGVDWERKGGPELMHAFAKVRAAHPTAELWICGCDPGVVAEGVRVFGRVSREAMSGYFSQADVFCLPSRMDPSASVLAEAAGNGLPVVATPVGGNLERVVDGETGYLCDPNMLHERLISLLSDPVLRERMGSAGRRLVLEQFTWPQVAARITENIRGKIT